MTKERVIEIMNEVLAYSGLDRAAFSSNIGEGSPQWIADILNPRKKVGISKAKATKICSAYPQISISYLLTGEGEMLNGDPDSVEDLIEDPDEAPPSKKMIPFYDAETTGGYNGLVSSSLESATLTGYIHAGDWFDGRETAAIRHVGDSMTEYPDGCILAVRQVNNFRLLIPGRNYVVETEEYRVTKRVQLGKSPDYIMLYSSNQECYPDGRLIHEPFPVDLADIRRIFSILGYIVNQSGEARLIRP